MLSQSQIANFKQKLLKKREYLTTELNKIASKNEEGKWEANFNEIARDTEANANEVEDFANDSSVVLTLSKDLASVEIAINKINNTDTYGKCETCQEYINPERLEIFPEAKNCMKCKQ